MIEEHLDVHWSDYRPVFPMIGKVVNVLTYEDPKNLPGKFTLYDVELYQQRPSTIHLADGVPYIGMNAGRAMESEDPLVLGQLVIVLFLEGDPNRPAIIGPYFDQEHITAVAQSAAEHPRVMHRRNGVDAVVSKDGELSVTLAPNQPMEIKDSAGNVLLEIVYSGGAYEVHLGGDSGLQKLMTEAMISAFNAHTHVETGGTTNTPLPQLSAGSHATSVVKAK